MNTKADIYDRITDKVIAGLETKGLQWFRPWNAGAASAPINWATGKRYNGINVFMLSAAMADHGYSANEWLTFKQAKDNGGQVRKGSKSEFVVFWNISFKTEDGRWFPNEAALRKAGLTPAQATKLFKPRWFNVFNIDQIEGLEAKHTVEPIEPIASDRYDAEWVYDGYEGRPSLAHGGEAAFYSPSKHLVKMPLRETFATDAHYWGTMFHELTHSTGHESVLNREGVAKMNGFGTERYAKEELVAEIGSQYLLGFAGIPADDENSQAYINGWVSKLKLDKKLALSAAQQAMHAANRILGL